jgi:hypothetical protein
MNTYERAEKREKAMATVCRLQGKGNKALSGALLALALVACDTDVTNPGPIQDSFLNDASAQDALVAGMERATGIALNWVAYTSAAIAREIHPSGSTGSFGITIKQQRGELIPEETSAYWNRAHRARFLTTDGIRGIEELEPSEQDQAALAEAYLLSGYAHRLLGESWCEGVIDQQVVPSTAYLDIAEAAFTTAAQLGTGDVATAAIAGRASVRAFRGEWGGAVSDAGSVPDDFEYVMRYFDLGDDVQSNRVHVSTKNEPYKAHTQWSTWIEEYGLSDNNPSGDPRVPYLVTDEDGDAAIDCCGTVPWWPQTKFANNDYPIELSSGPEMRLIEAENHLRNNELGPAVVIINDLRAAAGMDAVDPGTVEEGWTFLKRERAIEMWLEGRRLPDLRRWNDSGAPGELQPLEQVGDGSTDTGSHLQTRHFCYPIPDSEKETNPNLRTGG